MDKDEVKGKAKDVAGRIQRQAGEWTGDEESQAEGAAKSGDWVKATEMYKTAKGTADKGQQALAKTRDEAQAAAKEFTDALAATDVADDCDYEEAAGWFYRAARLAGAALKTDDLAGVKEQAREMMRFCEEGTRAAEESR